MATQAYDYDQEYDDEDVDDDADDCDYDNCDDDDYDDDVGVADDDYHVWSSPTPSMV